MRSVDTLLLAGRRPGPDPLLTGPDAPESKALISIDGVRMIDRVMGAIAASGRSKSIAVSGLAAAPEGAKLAAGGAGPAGAVAANEALGAPLFVTTCDHALLSSEIVRAFLDKAQATDADLVLAFATRTTIEAAYPGMRRTYLNIGGEGYSGCNLFLIRTPRAYEAVRMWTKLEAHRKSPRRLAFLIGPGLILRYLLRRYMTVDGLMAYVSKRAGARIGAVILPFADAAIDVDKPSDLDLVRTILRGRA